MKHKHTTRMKDYEQPIVTLIEVVIEQGFAASNESWGEGDHLDG